MLENNAICSICGTDYYVCKNCREKISLTPWKLYTDTSEHYKVFQIIRGYNTKVYTREEAKQKLLNVDLSDKDTYREHIRNRIDYLLEDVSIPKRKKKHRKEVSPDGIELIEETFESVVETEDLVDE